MLFVGFVEISLGFENKMDCSRLYMNNKKETKYYFFF